MSDRMVGWIGAWLDGLGLDDEPGLVWLGALGVLRCIFFDALQYALKSLHLGATPMWQPRVRVCSLMRWETDAEMNLRV